MQAELRELVERVLAPPLPVAAVIAPPPPPPPPPPPADADDDAAPNVLADAAWNAFYGFCAGSVLRKVSRAAAFAIGASVLLTAAGLSAVAPLSPRALRRAAERLGPVALVVMARSAARAAARNKPAAAAFALCFCAGLARG